MLCPHPEQNKQANGSHANFDDGLGDWSRNRFAVFFQTLDIALNGVTNIRHRLVARFPLGNTARQSRAFGNKNAVFIRFNRDTKFHAASVAISEAAGNAASDASTSIGLLPETLEDLLIPYPGKGPYRFRR